MKCTYLGKSKKEICNYLNNNNIVTPLIHKMQYTNYKNPNKNIENKWSVSSISNILKDRIYIGDLVQHKYASINYKIKKVVKLEKDKYIIIENNHEPIISKEQFLKVDQMLQQKANECKRTSKIHILTGIAFCQKCGSRITYTKNHGEKFKIICSNYKTNGKRACNNIYIEEQKVINLVKQKILKEIQNQNVSKIKIEKNIKNLEKIKELEKIQTRNLKAIKQVYDDIQQGNIDRKSAKQIIGQYILENEKMEKIIKELKEETKDKSINVFQTIANADLNQLRSLFFYLIEKIEISKQEIVVYYKFCENK